MPVWLTPLLGFLQPILDRYLPDKAKQAELQAELQQAALNQQAQQFEDQVKIALAQIDVNKAEASNVNWFVSGWRPYVGWVCGIGCTYTFILQPLLAWGSAIFKIPVPPSLDIAELMGLLGGILGMSTIRRDEKLKGVAAS